MMSAVKKEVRTKFLKQRRDFTRDRNTTGIDIVVCKKVMEYIEKQKYKNVAIYYEVHGEVGTEYLGFHIENTLYPKIKKNDIYFIQYDRYDLRGMPKNKWDVPEPIGNKVSLSDIDCVVVPGVAFDYDCNRLGYGGGFYDRALSNYEGDIIGVAYRFQVVERIPFVPYDVPVNKIFTEEENFSRL